MPDNPYVVNVTNDMALKIEGVIVEKGSNGMLFFVVWFNQ